MSLSALALMALLLLGNGFFVAAEFALIASRRTVLRNADSSRRTKAALALSDQLSLSLAAAQVGITLCSLLLGVVAEPAIASILELGLGGLPVSQAATHSISLVIALIITIFLHMVIGEMAPKNIAIAAPEKSALWIAVPFRAFLMLLRPLIAFLNWVANAVLRLFKVAPVDTIETTHSADELATIIGAGRQEGVIEEFTHQLLTGVFALTERDVSEVMVPRPDIVALTVSDTIEDVERAVRETGHSRIPIHAGDLDSVKGFVHAKDLLDLAETADAAHLRLDPAQLRPLLVVPESASVHGVLTQMQRTRTHLAVVVDEHGSTVGIVTLEDIAEELVGEIRDEHDPFAGEEIRRIGVDRFIVHGSLRTDRLRRVGLDIPEGEYETVAGFFMDLVGRVPSPGDTAQFEDWEMAVRRMTGRRIDLLTVTRSMPPASLENQQGPPEAPTQRTDKFSDSR